jgi:hypothetical protein
MPIFFFHIGLHIAYGANLLEMLDLPETLPKYSLSSFGGELENIITMLILGSASSKIGFGT